MATRKKKDSIVLEMPGTIGGAKVLAPTVVKGSHLTVTTYPDGRTELELKLQHGRKRSNHEMVS
jgi:hypothetical protein